MKTYKELMEEKEKSGLVKTLTPEFRKFEKEGDFVLGEFKNKETQRNEEEGTEFNQYLFQTDDGPVKFMLGGQGDQEIGTQLEKGGVYYIEFKGKEKTRRGYQVNRFDVVEIQAPPKSYTQNEQ